MIFKFVFCTLNWSIISKKYFKQIQFKLQVKYCRFRCCCNFQFPAKIISSASHCIKYPSNHFNPLELHSWGRVGCQMKQKSSRNWFFWVSAATFQSELNNLRESPKCVKKCNVMVFRSLFNCDWKVGAQTQKFNFHLVFCFIWHHAWPQGRDSSGD